jgi:opacity protein-like surface antigen
MLEPRHSAPAFGAIAGCTGVVITGVVMTRRMSTKGSRLLGIAALAGLLAPATADAQITRVPSGEYRQSIGVNFGWFGMRGTSARDVDDVLLANLEFLAFEIDDFNTATIGGEWLVGIGEYLEAGVGIGYQRRTVPTVYAFVVDDNGTDDPFDDLEIFQELKLRVVPFTATARFLPLGRRGSVQPYVGGGVAVFNWKYREEGEFVDFTDDTIFPARYEASGNAVGPVILAGIRAPVADTWMLGGEVRYQRGEGDTDPERSELLGSKIDLGGWSVNFGVAFRF